MKRLFAVALSAFLFTALMGCTPLQVDRLEEIYGIDIPAKVEREMIAAPNVRVTTPKGWLNVDGSLTPYIPPAGSRCPMHFGAAMQAGWAEADWPRLDYIIWRESRCQAQAHNPHGRDNSYGLLQLNMRAHAGWVAPIVEWDFTRLWSPVTNLTVGRLLFHKAHDAYGCGWQPWAYRC